MQNAASLPFSLEVFNSLDDILTSLNVDVIISDEVRYHEVSWKFLEKAEAYWRKKYEEECKKSKKEKSQSMKDAEERLSEINGTRNHIGNELLLGLYVPANNTVVLFPNAMNSIDSGAKMDELLVSVLAHETMHAYFNRPGHESFPYAMFVEEPLAEFGMLVYLEETKSPYFDYAYSFVKAKKSCYRFGAVIYDDYKMGGDQRITLENYKFELEDGEFSVMTSDIHTWPIVYNGKATAKPIGLSKSRYTLSRQCQKALWLSVYDKDKRVEDPCLQARFEEGNMVGDLAMGLLGPYIDVTVKVGGILDLRSMIQRTKDCLIAGVENICEASFSFYDKEFGLNYCAVDILNQNGDGYDIYEVKSSTDDIRKEKDNDDYYLSRYTLDIAYQKWVLQKCGIKVNNCYLVRINKEYVRKGVLSVRDFFIVKDMSDRVAKELPNVESQVKEAQMTLKCISEPKTGIGYHCREPYECAFKEYCFRDVPKPSVLDLYYFKKKGLDLYAKGKCRYSDLTDGDLVNNLTGLEIRKLQVKGETHIDKQEIKKFLGTLKYPLYFLDFETMMFAVPPYHSSKPYQQIPFQYSLHYQASEGSTLYHTEFLAESGGDPRREIAERLCADIPLDSCVVVYYKTFECSRLKELACLFPDLSAHLNNIANNIVDLYEPFKNGYYYLPAMGGSFSIKSVLPALFPGDPQFDYHNLSGGVQNGGEAMTIFPKIKDMAETQKTQARKALLDYCKLDTLAMVKIVERLYDAVK